ncbi:MAG TPA: efflux RND transporter permease subunit [Psychromonas hadalis]|nr:efflux RND transporter permease subunit [Psychromonas hadalis]
MIAFFTRHPTVANLLMLTFLVLGLTNISNIKRETFPEFNPPYINATVIYPGASPSQIEETICLRLEDAVDGLSNIEETTCDAQEGVASLRLKLTDSKFMSRGLLDVQTEINAIKDFPTEVETPIIKELNWVEPVIDIAVSGPMSKPDLKAYAEDLKHRLKVDAGVNLVSISGFSDHQLRVELNIASIRNLNLTVSEIAAKISRQNIQMPAGNVELADKNLLIRFDEQKVTPDELGKIVISANSTGPLVRLGDVATITDLFELEEEQIFFNGHPAAILNIKKNKADDALRIKDHVQAFVEHEQKIAPQGITLTLTNDLSSLLKDRLTMLIKNGWQGIILVFLSMWLFFSLPYSFWVSSGLPVAFLGGLYLMSVFSVSINIMTLLGLLMAIGIMMDDAIVLAESIASHLEKGLNADQAVIQGVQKVAPGVISSFLTTIFIFGSLLWLDGQMGAVLSVVPLVLILVLVISLVEAFLILPHHLNQSLKHQKVERHPLKFKRIFLEKFEHFRTVTLIKQVTFVVKWRYVSLGLTFALLLISVSLVAGGILKFNPFPELDGDIAEARIILPPGSTLDQTEIVVDRIVASAKKIGDQYTQENDEPAPFIRDITAHYNFNIDAGEKGPHVATVRLDLLSAEVRNSHLLPFLNAWRKEVGEMADPISLVFKQPAMGPAGQDIEIRLQHPDLDTLKTAAVEFQHYLQSFDGAFGVLDDMRPGKEEILITLKAGAEAYGVDGQTIASQLRAAYFGEIADEIQVRSENIEIQVQLNKKQAGDIHALENFPIMLSNGAQIPLTSVANLHYERSFVRIQRINALRTITVIADVDKHKANISELTAKIRQDFMPKLQQKYPKLRVDYEGSAKETAKTGASMIKGFLIGLFALFAILSFQFRSYLEPVIVMLAIPLALIGVFWGHLLTGHALSMPSMLGFISLAGIVVNDSILLVQYIRHHIDLGETPHEAVVKASSERFRAVFLTSLTTAAGLLPLLLETSLQAQIVQPVVVSIVFGIFASTLLVLYIIPSAYAVLADFDLVKKYEEI